MIANVSAHRRANAFAQALEDRTVQDAAAEQPADPAKSAEPAEQRRLLALASGLGELPRPTLDPEVKVVHRAQLIAAMEAMGAAGEGAGSPGPTVPEQRAAGRGSHRASPLGKLRPRSRWSKTLAAGGLTVGVAAGAFGGVAAASSNALPGDSLYGLKRGMEDIRLDMADSDTSRGGVYLDHASTRLNEARRLMERDRSGRLDHESLGEIRRTLTGMKNDAAEGQRRLHAAYEQNGSLTPIATLSSFAAAHREAWDGLRGRLPEQLTDVGDEVNSVFDAIDQEVAPLQSRLPHQADPDGQGPATGSGRQSGGAPGTDSPSHGTPSAGEGIGRSNQPTDGQSSSGPSGSASPHKGLLDGTGGLLTPQEPSHSGATAPSTPTNEPPAAPGPDVTIPPLVPDLLPGLGLDAGDADK